MERLNELRAPLLFGYSSMIARLAAEQRGGQLRTASAKLLITNLANHTQPLVRYELTDVLTARPADGHLQAQVQGRSDESFRYGAVSVHPFVLTVASAAKMRRSLLRR